MQINISGHHVDVTDALKSYVNSKMEKLERHSDQLNNIKVTLSVEKQRQKAEAHTHVAGTDISAQAEKPDMYASIDALVDKLDRQLLKHKEKMVGRRHDSVNIDVPTDSIDSESDAA